MKNMIKRIIVGVAVVLIVGFVRSCEVHAIVLNPYYGYVKTNRDINGGWVPGNYLIINNVNDTQFAYNNNITGIGMAFNGLPNDGNSYTIYGSGTATNSSVVIMVFGSNSGFNSTNINDLLVHTNRVSICYTSPTSNGINLPNSTYIYTNFTYSCSGLTGYSNYFIAIYDVSGNLPASGNVLGMLFSISYAPSNEVEVLQNIQIETEKQTQELNKMNDFLKDTSTPSDSEYNFSDNNADNGVINQLVTMPITLTQAFLNGFNGSCSPYNLGNLLGTDLILPCINPGNYLGVLWNVIDVIISGMFIYIFGKRLVKIFNDVTNMKENQIDEVFD